MLGRANARARVHAGARARVRGYMRARMHAYARARGHACARALGHAGRPKLPEFDVIYTHFNGAGFAQRNSRMNFPDRSFNTQNTWSPILVRCIDLRFSGRHDLTLMSFQQGDDGSYHNMWHTDRGSSCARVRIIKCIKSRCSDSRAGTLASKYSFYEPKPTHSELSRAALNAPFKSANDEAICGFKETVEEQCDQRTSFIAPRSWSRARLRQP